MHVYNVFYSYLPILLPNQHLPNPPTHLLPNFKLSYSPTSKLEFLPRLIWYKSSARKP